MLGGWTRYQQLQVLLSVLEDLFGYHSEKQRETSPKLEFQADFSGSELTLQWP